MESNRERIIDAIAMAFEDVYIQSVKVKEAHRLGYARGSALDSIGVLVNIPRLVNEIDTDYKLRLSKLTSIKVGAGTKDSIIEYIQNYLLLESDEFNVLEISPAHIQIVLIPALADREDEIYAALRSAIAAGIHYEIVYEEVYWDAAYWYEEGEHEDRWR